MEGMASYMRGWDHDSQRALGSMNHQDKERGHQDNPVQAAVGICHLSDKNLAHTALQRTIR